MKILQLELLKYGPFTDTTLDLSGGNPGLHIIYGPNEAGKTSTLRAINGLLYGIPTRTNDTFLHDAKSLRIGAVLQNSEQKKIHIHRRKGNKDTLLNPRNEKGGAYPKDALAPFLGAVDQDTFKRVYGISHEELQNGGDEMKSLKGLVGESLFAATVGGPGLAGLLRDLEAEATELYDPRKRNAKLKAAVRTHKELQSERRQLQLSKTTWVKLRNDLKKATGHRDEIVAKETELGKKRRRLQRIHDGLNLMTRRRELQQKLEKLGEAVVLPDNYSGDHRAETMAELNRTRKDIERFKLQLEGDGSLQSKIDAICIPEGLLEFDDAINKLKDDRAVTVKAATDTRDLGRRQETLKQQADRLLRDLGIEVPLAEAEAFRVTSDQRVVISNLGSDQKRLRETALRLKREREEIEKQIEDKTAELDKLGEVVDLAELKRAVDRIARMGDLQTEQQELTALVENQTADIQQQLAALRLWDGTIEQLGGLSLPLTETIDRCQEQQSAAQRAIEVAGEKLSELQAELLDAKKEIAALQSAGQIPSESELAELRSERDAQWQRIRDAFVAGKKPKDTTVPAYEGAVKAADMLADRLRREAERVTQLAERQALQLRIVEQIEQLNEQLQSHQTELQSWATEWNGLWSATGINSPLPPKEMYGWLRKVEALQGQAKVLAEKQREHDRVRKSYDEVREELHTLLQANSATVAAKTSLARLLETAEAFIEKQDELASERSELTKEIARLTKAGEAARLDEKQITDETAEWQTKWTDCMKSVGSDEAATAEQANERVQRLTELFDLADDIAKLDTRLKEIAEYTTQFEEDVDRLGRRFLPDQFSDLANPPVYAELAVQLYAMFEAARSGKATLHDLEDKIAAVQLELTDATEREGELSTGLELLLNLAGAKSVEQLPGLERSAKEYEELKTRLDDVDDELRRQSGSQTIEEFIESAADFDADELPEQIKNVEVELKSLEGERDAAVVAVNELEREIRTADGSDEAASKDQQSLGILSGMHDDAAQYMRLKLASTMLRKQIAEHRAENEDPLLERASTLFATMTCGEYSGLKSDYDGDQPVIVGVRRDSDEPVPVDAMSDGTRDQLYLALRLGYVERQLIQNEPMPFIVDDILVHFDNDRSASTLKVLGDLAQQTQVIFLTHHEHLIDLAKESLPSGECFVHRIDSRQRAHGLQRQRWLRSDLGRSSGLCCSCF